MFRFSVGYYWKFEESPTTLPTIAGEGLGGWVGGWGLGGAGNFFSSGKNLLVGYNTRGFWYFPGSQRNHRKIKATTFNSLT